MEEQAEQVKKIEKSNKIHFGDLDVTLQLGVIGGSLMLVYAVLILTSLILPFI